MTIFRVKQKIMDVKFGNCKSYKFWRFVLVDHLGDKQSWFKGIGWYVKKIQQQTEPQQTGEIDTSDLIFNSA